MKRPSGSPSAGMLASRLHQHRFWRDAQSRDHSTTRMSPPRRSRLAHWLFTGLAGLSVAVLAATALAMAVPLPFDSVLGLLGAILLIFPLHLLIVTGVTMMLALFARRRRARAATALFTVAALASAVMAIAPSAALWLFARHENVSLSLGEYLRYGAHLNLGSPQPDRSVSYGTAADGTTLMLDVWRGADDGDP